MPLPQLDADAEPGCVCDTIALTDAPSEPLTLPDAVDESEADTVGDEDALNDPLTEPLLHKLAICVGDSCAEAEVERHAVDEEECIAPEEALGSALTLGDCEALSELASRRLGSEAGRAGGGAGP